jgi:hypothetical protein
MAGLAQYLNPITVKLEDLLLDPNNPRFAELGQTLDAIPEARFGEPNVQKKAYEVMKTTSRFDVEELRDTIKTMGFLPMDRIVVREWRSGPKNNKKFIVVEGNRRVTALKWLIELQNDAKETFSDEQLKNFTELEVLLLDDLNAEPSSKLVIPGLRHVSGIKEWGAYQKARTVYILREGGKSQQDVAQSLGLSVIEANRLWRSYLALDQMLKDEEYSEYAQPKLYSYFEEVLRRPAVKNWLGWKDDAKKFTNEERLREFYGWVVGEANDEGERSEVRKLPEAKSVRDLAVFIEDGAAMAAFRAPDGTLTKAGARFAAEHPQDWLPNIISAEAVLATLAPDVLRAMKAEELQKISALKNRIEKVLKDREKLLTD